MGARDRKHAANGYFVLDAVNRYWNGAANLNLLPREMDGRATGDEAPVTITNSGLANDANVTFSGVMEETIGALITYNGTTASIQAYSGLTTSCDLFSCSNVLLRVTPTYPANDLGTLDVVMVPQVLPTVPSCSGFAML